MVVRAAILALSIAVTACAPPVPEIADGSTTPHPTVSDWNSVRIKLERTGCFGFCPAYTVEIRGDGAVTYCGGEFVKERGERSKRVPVESVRNLVAKFMDAGFFALQDEYVGGVDAPFQILTFTVDGRSKRVLESLGEGVGMPLSVPEIGDAIDAASGSRDWVGQVRQHSGATPEACMEDDRPTAD